MKIKYILPILMSLFVLLMTISCINAHLQNFQELPPIDTVAIEREINSPDSAALQDLDTLITRTRVARKKGVDIDTPNIFPADWKSADSLYTNAEQQKKTSTIREIQESSTRYSITADAFEKVNEKTLPLLAADKKQELAEARRAAAKYIAEEKARGRTVAVATTTTPTTTETRMPAAATTAPASTEISKHPVTTTIAAGELHPLPAQYTVRPWSVSGDSLHNIAGRSWVYNDPCKWRVLFEANKNKMPEPDNPGLIEPGMILDIPIIRGEDRQGMWQENRNYPIMN
ncbi:MAG: LysM peptidoglycan-binding domain-containing protein [Spirochaetaceae bacterium]|nr:LysM peptidoglycan-binding domain-containing protein [Spirochaetaceae bacterium]